MRRGRARLLYTRFDPPDAIGGRTYDFFVSTKDRLGRSSSFPPRFQRKFSTFDVKRALFATRPQLLHSKSIIFFRNLPVISAVSLDLFLVG